LDESNKKDHSNNIDNGAVHPRRHPTAKAYDDNLIAHSYETGTDSQVLSAREESHQKSLALKLDKHKPVNMSMLRMRLSVMRALIFSLFALPHASSLSASSSRRQLTKLSNDCLSRRQMFQQSVIVGVTAPEVLGWIIPLPSLAVDEDIESALTAQIVKFLHPVPTFTIVDAKGVPYMVVGEDARVSGYFFTSFAEAQRILTSAKTSADKAIAASLKEDPNQAKEDLINPWKTARISTVPLDTAVTITTKASSRKNYFYIAPAESDIEEALEISQKKDLAEGKVPLFYYENYTIPIEGSEPKTPVYFSKSQLQKAYARDKSSSKEDPGPVMVSELYAILAAMIEQSTSSSSEDDLQNLVLIPPQDSLKRAKECLKKQDKEAAAFLLGQRNLVL